MDSVEQKVENLDLKKPPCSTFNSWSFKLANDTVIHIHTIKYSSDYLYIWLSNNDARLENLSFAIQTKYEKLPIGINVLNSSNLGNDSQQYIDNLTSKLSFKLKKQVLLSFNAELNTSLPEFILNIEKALFSEIKTNREKF